MSGPPITVLMATRNGARFLGEQLDSLERQSFADWRLMVSDDGSDDGTWAMLETFLGRIGADRASLFRGPEMGATANFLSLIARTGPQDGCVAFCDQDDIWLPDKLARAAEALAGADVFVGLSAAGAMRRVRMSVRAGCLGGRSACGMRWPKTAFPATRWF